MKFKNWPFYITVIWFLTCLSLTSWWLYFGLKQLSVVGGLTDNESVFRHQRMLVYEGLFLICLLLFGAFALFYLIRKEKKQNQMVRDLFANFSHNTKTSLASLRLQAESLSSEVNSKDLPVLKRLIEETVHLEFDLENSMYYAKGVSGTVFIESVLMSSVLEKLNYYWPNIKLELIADFKLKLDPVKFKSILKNLIQNSVHHGNADKIIFKKIQYENANKTIIKIIDNGTGYKGDCDQLGLAIGRNSQSSRTGLGLYLVRKMISEMKAKVVFSNLETCEESTNSACSNRSGFCVDLCLPQELFV